MQIKSLLISTLLLITPASVFAADPTQRTSDLWIESKIDTTYQLNPTLTSFPLDVNVMNGTAILSGAVEETTEKELAELIAMSTDGINKVENNIVIKEDARTPRSTSDTPRSFSQTVSDATTTARVKSKLLWNTRTDGLTINVDTNNGLVTLQGTVDSSDVKKLAARLAMTTPEVRKVNNELIVSPEVRASMKKSMPMEQATGGKSVTLGSVDLDKTSNNLGAALGDTGKSIKDAWISAKVSSTLAFTRGLDSSDIDVTAQNGIVTLKGTARDRAELQLAEELAKDIKGVKSVKNNMIVESQS